MLLREIILRFERITADVDNNVADGNREHKTMHGMRKWTPSECMYVFNKETFWIRLNCTAEKALAECSRRRPGLLEIPAMQYDMF